MYLGWLLFYLASFGLASATGNCSYKALIEHLGLGSDDTQMTSLRPVLNWKTPTLIYTDLYVTSITGVDEKAQSLSTQVTIAHGWFNELIKWNPEDFCGITICPFKKDMVWSPDIIISESINTEFATKENQYVRMNNQGIIMTSNTFAVTTACKMNLHRFPFDVQICTFTLQSPIHSNEELLIHPFSGASFLTLSSKQAFQTQGEWEFLSINMSKANVSALGEQQDLLIYKVQSEHHIRPAQSHARVKTLSIDERVLYIVLLNKKTSFSVIAHLMYNSTAEILGSDVVTAVNRPNKKSRSSFSSFLQITMKRRPLLYVINFLMPVFYFLILDLASFFIDSSGGEKLGFKVTLLLAISVLLLLLQDMLPSTASDIPLIGVYCVVIFTLIGISVLETILMNFLMAKANQTDAGRPTQSSSAVSDAVKDTKGPADSVTDRHEEQLYALDVLKQILMQFQASATHQNQQEKKSLSWTRVVSIINLIFFFLYVTTVIVFLITLSEAWFM